jgi:hypothetical protein
MEDDFGILFNPESDAAVGQQRLGSVGGLDDVCFWNFDTEGEVAQRGIEPHASLGGRGPDVPSEDARIGTAAGGEKLLEK